MTDRVRYAVAALGTWLLCTAAFALPQWWFSRQVDVITGDARTTPLVTLFGLFLGAVIGVPVAIGVVLLMSRRRRRMGRRSHIPPT